MSQSYSSGWALSTVSSETSRSAKSSDHVEQLKRAEVNGASSGGSASDGVQRIEAPMSHCISPA